MSWVKPIDFNGSLNQGLTEGGYTGSAIPIAMGGTASTTASAAFNALQPMTTGGDLIYGGSSGAATRLGNGTSGYVLSSTGTTLGPAWILNTVTGTVSSIDLSVPAVLTVSGNPITTTGTLAITYSGSALSAANGGTGGTSVPSAPAATSFAAWDANKNLPLNNLLPSNHGITGTTTTMDVTYANVFICNVTGHGVKLPTTSTLSIGMEYTIINQSSGTFAVDNHSVVTILTMAANTMAIFSVQSASTGVDGYSYLVLTLG